MHQETTLNKGMALFPDAPAESSNESAFIPSSNDASAKKLAPQPLKSEDAGSKKSSQVSSSSKKRRLNEITLCKRGSEKRQSDELER